MAFTAQEVSNIANATLDHYVKGKPFMQTIQARPLLDHFMKKQQTFPGGRGNIDLPIKGDITPTLSGFSHNDTVTYSNPANIKRVFFPWKEVHCGISLTLTELKKAGISVVDSQDSASTSKHSGTEMMVLVDLLEDKLDEMAEGWARGFNDMLWRDGSQDAKLVAGVTSIVVDDPTVGVLGGLSRATTADSKGFYYWRNRSAVGASKITASAANQTLSKFLRKERRQLVRYGGKPTIILAGSQFIEALELELSEKGAYTQDGFTNKGRTDIGIADIALRGLGVFQYDPTLDDLGYSKRCYVLDTDNIQLNVMEGEDRKTHTPTRPADQYVMYRAMTWTGGLVARQVNSSAVYEVA